MQVIISKSVGDFVVRPCWNSRGQITLEVSYQDRTSDGYLTTVKGKRVLATHLEIDGKSPVYLVVTPEQEQELREMMEAYRREYRARWGRGEFRPVLRWEQEVSNYDWPTIALNKWRLSLESEQELERLGLLHLRARLWSYAREKVLFREEQRLYRGWSEVQLKDYVLELTPELVRQVEQYLTPEERKQLEQEREELRRLLADEQALARKIFVGLVHVNEEGYFSDCPPYCDDCVWRPHVKREYIDHVRDVAARFTVRSRRGKAYTYYRADDKVLAYLMQKLPDVVEAERSRLKSRLSEIQAQLEKDYGHSRDQA